MSDILQFYVPSFHSKHPSHSATSATDYSGLPAALTCVILAFARISKASLFFEGCRGRIRRCPCRPAYSRHARTTAQRRNRRPSPRTVSRPTLQTHFIRLFMGSYALPKPLQVKQHLGCRGRKRRSSRRPAYSCHTRPTAQRRNRCPSPRTVTRPLPPYSQT